MNGYNFTERVRAVLALSRQEVVALNHGYVGPEHILLGLLREGEGVGASALRNLGVDASATRDRLIATTGNGIGGGPTGPDVPYSTRAKKVLEHAMTASRDLEHPYVGTEHLLLGLLADRKSIATQMLNDQHVDLDGA